MEPFPVRMMVVLHLILVILRAIKWVTMKTVTKKTILEMKTRAHLEVGSLMIVDLKDMVPLVGNLMLLLNQSQ